MAMPAPVPGDPVSEEYRSLAAKSRGLAESSREALGTASAMAWSSQKPPKKLPKDPSGSIASKEAIWIGLRPKSFIYQWRRTDRGVRRMWLKERIETRGRDWLNWAGGWR
jgi:hypothetical protein